MFIFLDESGDLGFDFANKKPSKYFVITLLVCKEKSTVDALKFAVKKTLKNKINNKAKGSQNELKASYTFYHVKEYFYKHISDNNDWEIYSIILNKEETFKKIRDKPQVKNLYNFLSRKILERVKFNNKLSRVELIVDKSKNDSEIQIFNEYLANHLASYLPLQTKLIIDHVHSFAHHGLQAVDLFSWGIFRKYECADLRWYNLFCYRIITEEQI
jgi:hypothetical protein